MKTKESRTMKDRWRMIGILLIASLFIGGCAQLEIEERAFPLALSVTGTDTADSYDFTFYFEETEGTGSSLYHKEDVTVRANGYPQAYALFGRMQAAQPDDSHMQVILLSEALVDKPDFLDVFYSYAMKEHHFSWNTVVYLIPENMPQIRKLADHTTDRPGSYLRDMAQSDEQEKTAGVPTLGDLYMEWQNREKVLLLPVLGDHFPLHIDHYRIMDRGKAQKNADPDTARLIQLLQGKLRRMQLELSDRTVVELEDIRTGRKYSSQTGRWCVTIRAEAATQNRIRLTEPEKKRVQKECVDLLRRHLAPLTKWALIKDADGQLVRPQYVLDIEVTE